MKRLALLLLPLPAARAQFQMPAAQASPPPPELAPIAPPVDVFPYPPWMVVSAGALAALLVGLLIWACIRWARQRAVPAPLPPREAALLALRNLQPRAAEAEPYPFSIEVCDILRLYITRQFRIRATAQTSPEFLAAISAAQAFSEDEKALLAAFLEKADLIKFARVAASGADSEQLLEQAFRFVNGKEAA